MRTLFVVLLLFEICSAVGAQPPVLPDSIPDPGTFIPFDKPPSSLPDVCPQPEFPPAAITAGMTGEVKVQVYVTAEGVPAKWKIHRAEPEGWGFEAEAVNAVRHWRFSPAMQKGQPVGVWVMVPFNFKYRGSGAGRGLIKHPAYLACAVDTTLDRTYPDPEAFVPIDAAPQPLAEAFTQPAFPEPAKEGKIGGSVVVRMLVNARGEVVKWAVVYVDPKKAGFEDAVAEVVCGWRFRPALSDGVPRSVWVNLPINFKSRKAGEVGSR